MTPDELKAKALESALLAGSAKVADALADLSAMIERSMPGGNVAGAELGAVLGMMVQKHGYQKMRDLVWMLLNDRGWWEVQAELCRQQGKPVGRPRT